MKVTPFLWFSPADARAAIELYGRLVPDFRLVSHRHLDNAPDAEGTDVYDVHLAGQDFQVMGAANNQPFGMAVSLSLVVADQAELDAFWDGLLAAGGSEVACSWISDPWGLMWQVVPQVFVDTMAHGTPAQAQAVAEACWSMVRMDVARIEAARDAAA